MPMTDEVEELLKVLGPFYELVDEKKKIVQISDLSTGWCFLARWIAHTFYFVMWSLTSFFASCYTLSPFDSVC